jgi:hypothetical protein
VQVKAYQNLFYSRPELYAHLSQPNPIQLDHRRNNWLWTIYGLFLLLAARLTLQVLKLKDKKQYVDEDHVPSDKTQQAPLRHTPADNFFVIGRINMQVI